METAVYAVEAETEATHWWFVGRRKLFARELRIAGVPSHAAILDVGTATGSNLRMLGELGFRNVTGLDDNDEAIRLCAAKGLGNVRKGDIRALPFPDNNFDFVLATDVIEHIEEDARAVHEIARVLKPDGRVLISVPAFPSLWGLQDRKALHKRRYRMSDLLRLAQGTGLRIERNYHFNYLLFLPIYAARRIIELAKFDLQSENQVNSTLLNAVLTMIFSLDVSTAPILHPPFGVSILMVLSKDA